MLKSNFKKQQDQQEEYSEDEYQSNVPDAQNSVGTGKARKLINIIVAIAIFGLVFYFIFSQESDTENVIIESTEIIEPGTIPQPSEDAGSPVIEEVETESTILSAPTLPELPAVPDLPFAPDDNIYNLPVNNENVGNVGNVRDSQQESSEVPAIAIENTKERSDNNVVATPQNKAEDPRRTKIFMGEVGQLPPGNSVGYDETIVDLTGNAIQEPETIIPPAPTSGKDLSQTISKGKMLIAILETAINTEVPGDIRGIVSRDVYAEAGTNILIPKGTRLFGSYSGNIDRGQARVEINWTKIIRPDGLELSVSFAASDQYGRSGIEGEVDNQYTSTVANTLLSSVLAVGGALATDALIGNDNATTTTGSDGSVISTSSASAQVITQVTEAIIDTVVNTIEESINIEPIIRIPHGTKMTVIVSNDITLPPYKY
jgi:type IV secretion system protein VirB10